MELLLKNLFTNNYSLLELLNQFIKNYEYIISLVAGVLGIFTAVIISNYSTKKQIENQNNLFSSQVNQDRTNNQIMINSSNYERIYKAVENMIQIVYKVINLLFVGFFIRNNIIEKEIFNDLKIISVFVTRLKNNFFYDKQLVELITILLDTIGKFEDKRRSDNDPIGECLTLVATTENIYDFQRNIEKYSLLISNYLGIDNKVYMSQIMEVQKYIVEEAKQDKSGAGGGIEETSSYSSEWPKISLYEIMYLLLSTERIDNIISYTYLMHPFVARPPNKIQGCSFNIKDKKIIMENGDIKEKLFILPIMDANVKYIRFKHTTNNTYELDNIDFYTDEKIIDILNMKLEISEQYKNKISDNPFSNVIAYL